MGLPSTNTSKPPKVCTFIRQAGAASYKNVSSRSKASRLMGLRRYPVAWI